RRDDLETDGPPTASPPLWEGLRKARLLALLASLAASASGASAANISTWFAPSAAKIMRTARPAGAPQEWDLAAARNEVESCQLVLSADEAVAGVKVTATPLEQEGGTGRLDPALFKVEYVPITRDKVPYPDPLPPLAGTFDLQPQQAQPVWISIRVPKGAAPGAYRGTITAQAGSWTRRLALRLQVWKFTLPDTPACVTAFGNPVGSLAEWHGVPPGSPESKSLDKKYYEFLLEHRISPMFIPADLMSPEAAAYLNDPRMTSYLIPYEENDDKLKSLLARLIEGNWFKKGYFYVVDEPVNKPAFDALVAVSDRLRQLEPRYRLVAPFWARPDFDAHLRATDLMLGRVNIWCPHLDYVESEPGIRQFLQNRRNAGDTVWWYVCNNPREPRNNLQIDQNAMAHRTLPWQQKREGFQGLLYWSVCAWNKSIIKDPWENMDTLGTGFYGDGSLVYPGRKVGVDGPVSSQRLEVFRDGLEDYDYLALADQLLGPEVTAGYVAKIARSLTDYERDPQKLEPVRGELGAALEKATATPRPD
ncbi:MAG TPA: glycoside hydrolase domain-containing protein, partial [Rhodocyclaceae bacterium]|nr:glycoside hydrolase domain-containing protein [Rhodocyclaceae bacterium]